MKLINLEFVIKQQSLRIYKKNKLFHKDKKKYFTEIYDAIESSCYPSGITGHVIYAVNMKIT